MYPEYSRAWCTMSEKHTSGHCRWIPLTVLFVILFCSAAASAATASAATTAACPSGCSCMQPAAAQEKGYDACGGQLTACGYDVFQKTMYCYKTPQIVIPVRTLQTLVIATTTQPGSCPAGCSCMMEAEAKEKFGSYFRCSETPCYSVVTGSATLKAYCFRQGTPPTTTTPVPACPQGCTCQRCAGKGTVRDLHTLHGECLWLRYPGKHGRSIPDTQIPRKAGDDDPGLSRWLRLHHRCDGEAAVRDVYPVHCRYLRL